MAQADKSSANSLRYSIAQTGGKILDKVSSISPTVGGTLGSAVNKVGNYLGNPLPETGATERAQSAGGYAEYTKAVQSGDTNKIKELEQKAIKTAGQPSANYDQIIRTNQAGSGSVNPNDVSQLKDQRSMGANVGDIRNFGGVNWRWNGESWESQQPQGQQTAPPSKEQIRASLDPSVSGFIDEEAFNARLANIADADRKSAEQIAAEIEAAETENAEREYNAVMDALRVQKGEVQTIGSQQQERVRKEKELTSADMAASQDKEVKTIEQNRQEFEEERQTAEEKLGKNFRDMSLYVQRIMRARGVTDSQYAQGEEGKYLKDLNQGLRNIAASSTKALANFADAINETVSFYERQKTRLDFEVQNSLDDIDNWMRGQIQSIQAQENMSLTKKLNVIRNAQKDALVLKQQTEQKIRDRQAGFDMWLMQMDVQFKQAVALAAQNKVGEATQNINDVRNTFKLTSDILANGGDFTQDENGQWYVHGTMPGSDEDIYMPVSGGFVQSKRYEFAKDYANLNNPINQGAYDTGLGIFDQAYGMQTTQPQQQTQEKPSLWKSIFGGV